MVYDHKIRWLVPKWDGSTLVFLWGCAAQPSVTFLGPRQVSRTFPCSHLTLSLALSFACLRWITVLASTLGGQKKKRCALPSLPWCPGTVIIFLMNLFEQCEVRFTPLTEFCCSSPLCRCLVNPSVFSWPKVGEICLSLWWNLLSSGLIKHRASPKYSHLSTAQPQCHWRARSAPAGCAR